MFIILLFWFPLSGHTISIFTCESNRIEGDRQTLSLREYPIIYPTIIIDIEKGTLIHVYSAYGQKYEQLYKIIESDGNNIIGKIHSRWDVNVNMIHFRLDEKEFSMGFLGEFGNTLEFGKCIGD